MYLQWYPDNFPEENSPRLRLGLGLELGLVLGLGEIFFGGNCPRSICHNIFCSRVFQQHEFQLLFHDLSFQCVILIIYSSLFYSMVDKCIITQW